MSRMKKCMALFLTAALVLQSGFISSATEITTVSSEAEETDKAADAAADGLTAEKEVPTKGQASTEENAPAEGAASTEGSVSKEEQAPEKGGTLTEGQVPGSGQASAEEADPAEGQTTEKGAASEAEQPSEEPAQTEETALVKAQLFAAEAAVSEENSYDLSSKAVNITEGGKAEDVAEYTITQSNAEEATNNRITIAASNVKVTVSGVNIKTAEEGTNAITVAEGYENVMLVLNGATLDVGTRNGAGVLVSNDSKAKIVLQGENKITSSYAAAYDGENDEAGQNGLKKEMNPEGIRIGGSAADSSTGKGELLITGKDLTISGLGAGIVVSRDAKAEISGADILVEKTKALPSTATGRAILAYGDLSITNQAEVIVDGVETGSHRIENDTPGGHLETNYGYGFVVNQSLTIQDSKVIVKNCESDGIYGDTEFSHVDAENAVLDFENMGHSAILITTASSTTETNYVHLSGTEMTVDKATYGIAVGANGQTSLTIDKKSEISMSGIGYNGIVATTNKAGFVLIDDSKVTVANGADGEYIPAALGGQNTGAVTIQNGAVVTAAHAREGLGLGSAEGNGTTLTITGGAQLLMTDITSDGIQTYGGNQITVTEGGVLSIETGEKNTAANGINLASDGSGIRVNDATVKLDAAGKGVEVSDSNTAVTIQDKAHVEATNVVAKADKGSDCAFTVTGGTLTYDYTADNSLWPTNGSGSDDGVSYTGEKLFHFLVPADEAHLSFEALGWNDGKTVPYAYISDAEKEDGSLSIWVPGVEIYYHVDEAASLKETDLTGKTVSGLETNGVKFVQQYGDNYDVCIRGRSIAFTKKADGKLYYAQPKTNGVKADTTEKGIDALYNTNYKTSAGKLYKIVWFYGEPEDDGPLTAFGTDRNVTRQSKAGIYGVLTAAEPIEAEWDSSKSKTATELKKQSNGTYTSEVTLSLPAAEEQLVSDVVFVLDKSTSAELENEALAMLSELKTQVETVGAKVKVGVVIFNKQANVTDFMDLSTQYGAIETAIRQDISSGTNTHAGLLAGKEMLDNDKEVDASRKYLIFVSDGITYMYDKTGTPTAIALQNGDKSGWFAGPDNWETKYGSNNAPEEGWAAYLKNVGNLVETDKETYERDYIGSSKDEGNISLYLSYADRANHAMSIDKALYLTNEVYESLKSSYHCYAMAANTSSGENYTWGPAFMEYLAGGENVSFEKIHNDIYYLLSAGSRVEDYMGYVENDYNFDFVNALDKLTLKVGDKVLEKTQLEANKYGFGAKNGSEDKTTYPYVLTYEKGNGTTEEHFVWDINVPVSRFDRVQLTYTVVLTNPKTAAGTYGQYDADGSKAYAGLYTNNRATLYPVDSFGNEVISEDFQKPTVSYTVAKPADPAPSGSHKKHKSSGSSGSPAPSSTQPVSSAKTNDTNNAALPALLLLLSALLLGGYGTMVYRKRRRS